MGNSEENSSSEKVLIVPLSDESRKITQILSNEKAMKMLDILADKPMSASDVAEKLDMPLTTVKYNLDGLIEADLIQVKETKWSRKGREVKIYEPVQKLIVVAPGSMKGDRSSIVSMLKKYLGLVAGAVFAASGLEAITRSFGTGPKTSQDAAYTAPLFAEDDVARTMSKEAGMENATFDATGETTGQMEEMPEIQAEEFRGSEYTADNEVMDEAVVDDVAADDGYMDDADIDMDQGTMETDSMDYDFPADSAVSDGVPGVDDVSPEMLASSAPNGTQATDVAREGMYAGAGNHTYPSEMSQGFTDNMSAMSEPVGGIFRDGLLSHISVWFFFGCIFIIVLLFVREMYYRKKNI